MSTEDSFETIPMAMENSISEEDNSGEENDPTAMENNSNEDDNSGEENDPPTMENNSNEEDNSDEENHSNEEDNSDEENDLTAMENNSNEEDNSGENDPMAMENNNNEEDESDNGEENERQGNFAWADAMCKLLNTKNIKKKNFILSKAKKDSEIKVKRKHDIEIVDESGNVVNSEENKEAKSSIQIRKRLIQKHKQKLQWEAMCRVKPDIKNKDKERELIKIATRGVVHLFNTVEKHQKKTKNTEEKIKARENLSTKKGDFMDILKGYNKKEKESQSDPVAKKAKQEATWSILKDDFMLGAEMKDWDKESDNDN